MFRRFVVLMAAALPLAVAADIRVIEEIAAKVNGDIITRGELEQGRREVEADARRSGLKGAELTNALQAAQASILRDQIDELLLMQHAKDININVDAEVTRTVARMQVASGISDPDKFASSVRQEYGITLEEFKQRQKTRMLAERAISAEVDSRISIPDAELRAYYEANKNKYVREDQVFLSQILISTEGKSRTRPPPPKRRPRIWWFARAPAKSSANWCGQFRRPRNGPQRRLAGPGFKRDRLRKEIGDHRLRPEARLHHRPDQARYPHGVPDSQGGRAPRSRPGHL